MGLVDIARLRRAFDDPGEWVADRPTARAASLLLEHGLARVARAAVGAELSLLLVKGGALAETVYPEAWMRPMSDVDLVVEDADLRRAVCALEEVGFREVAPPAGRDSSHELFHEVALVLPVGPGCLTVELHVSLDKVVRRGIDWSGVRERATVWKPGIALPSLEDELLLVVLHAATSDFDHPVAWLDLELLLAAGPDLAVVVARARQWSLCTALHVALRSLALAGSRRVPEALLASCRPSRARELMLSRFFDLERFPPQRARSVGARWMLRQTALRDDTAAWLRGCASYAATRLRERALSASGGARPGHR